MVCHVRVSSLMTLVAKRTHYSAFLFLRSSLEILREFFLCLQISHLMAHDIGNKILPQRAQGHRDGIFGKYKK